MRAGCFNPHRCVALGFGRLCRGCSNKKKATDPEVRARHRAAMADPEVRARKSAAMKRAASRNQRVSAAAVRVEGVNANDRFLAALARERRGGR